MVLVRIPSAFKDISVSGAPLGRGSPILKKKQCSVVWDRLSPLSSLLDGHHFDLVYLEAVSL